MDIAFDERLPNALWQIILNHLSPANLARVRHSSHFFKDQVHNTSKWVLFNTLVEESIDLDDAACVEETHQDTPIITLDIKQALNQRFECIQSVDDLPYDFILKILRVLKAIIAEVNHPEEKARLLMTSALKQFEYAILALFYPRF